MVKVRVIVVTYNNEHDIIDCINSLFSGGFTEMEVFVVDNASMDRTVELINMNFPRITLIKNERNLGFTLANNIALTGQIPDFIAFVNPDTISGQNWLSKVLEEMQIRSTVGACQPRIMLYIDKSVLNSRGNEANFLFFGWPEGCGDVAPKSDSIRNIPYASGCAAIYRSECIKKLKGFDDSFFMYGDDVDLGVRLFLLGYDTIYLPDAEIYHKYKFRQSGPRYFLLERNRLRILLKIYKKRTLIFMLPIILGSESGVILRSIHEKWLKNKLLAYGSVARHLPDLVRKRREVQGYRTRSDAELIYALRGAIIFPPLEGSVMLRRGNRLLDKYREFLIRMRI
jgi:GT2 family glycosyltransferase